MTSETERSVTGLSRSSSRVTTQFDFPESLTEESSAESTAPAVVIKVYFYSCRAINFFNRALLTALIFLTHN